MLKWFFIPFFFLFLRPAFPQKLVSDTIEDKQDLYNGIKWTNEYRNFESDQFLFSGLFLYGSVTINDHTWRNLKIKYDIYSDEIITPLNHEDIIQLNKEVVDSFTLQYNGRNYRFINIHDSVNGYSGYFNSLYEGNHSLLVKYKKVFSSPSRPESDGNFIETRSVYLYYGNAFYKLKGIKSFYRIVPEADRIRMRDFIKARRIKISRKDPYSFIPLIQYYDDNSHPVK